MNHIVFKEEDVEGSLIDFKEVLKIWIAAMEMIIYNRFSR